MLRIDEAYLRFNYALPLDHIMDRALCCGGWVCAMKVEG